MPAELLENPAGISCVFSDGRRFRRAVAAEPAGLVRDLLEGLAGLVHPHGSVDSPGTVIAYVQGIVDIARFVRERGAGGGAAQLSRGLLAEYWMQAGDVRESVTRRMLVSFDVASGGGALQPGARALADGRHFAVKPASSPLVPYTEEEWARLHQACRDDVDEAFARHRQALRLAAAGQDPRDGGGGPPRKRGARRGAATGPPSGRTKGAWRGGGARSRTPDCARAATSRSPRASTVRSAGPWPGCTTTVRYPSARQRARSPKARSTSPR